MPRIKVTKKPSSKKAEKEKEWPVVVYLWAMGLGLVSYVVAETAFRNSEPHPVHWISGLIGGVLGVGIGWLWYRWRGDVF